MFSAWRPVHNVHTHTVFLASGWEKMTSVRTWMRCCRHRECSAVMSGTCLLGGGFNDRVV